MPSAQSEDAMNVWTRLVFVHLFFYFYFSLSELFFMTSSLKFRFLAKISSDLFPNSISVLSEVYSLLLSVLRTPTRTA